MDILFLHQNMPGQYKHLAPVLARDPANRVVFLTKRRDVDLPGVRRITYAEPKAAAPETHHYVRLFENSVRYGQQVVRASLELRKEGFDPAIVIAHPGWGEALFVKDIFPKATLLTFAEFYYRGRGADLGFEGDKDGDNLDMICRARARNAHLILSLEAADAAVSPTQWQKSVHPADLRRKIEVIFDGIDTDVVRPVGDATFVLPDGRALSRADPVVTYVARNLEPYRGFPHFMRAAKLILDARPEVTIVVVGGDEVSYGASAPDKKTWRETLLEEVPLDKPPYAGRIHFLGKLPYNRYLDLLRVSSAHIYLTVPFVLSWSCVEAMASGCLIVASDTKPVQEVIEDGRSGLMVPFGDPAAIAERVGEALDRQKGFERIRKEARSVVLERYALNKCLPAQLAMVARLTGARALKNGAAARR